MGRLAVAFTTWLAFGVVDVNATVHYFCSDGSIVTIRYVRSETEERQRVAALYPCVGDYHRGLELRTAIRNAGALVRKRPTFFPEGR